PARPESRGDAQPHDVREGEASRAAVTGRPLERGAGKPAAVPVVELAGRQPGEPGDVRRGEAARNDSAEFHRCNLKILAQEAQKYALTGAGPDQNTGYGEERKMAMMVLWMSLLLHRTADPAVNVGSALYRATLIQAAPGKLLEVVELVQAGWPGTRDSGDAPPLAMRH